MTCRLRDELAWDNTLEVLHNFDTAKECGEAATHQYVGGVTSDLCERHAARWSLIIEHFTGKIVKKGA